MAGRTTVKQITAEQWAARFLRLYPNRWTSDAAKVAGGIMHAWFNAVGTQTEFLQGGLDWALNATRIATAKDAALDAIAEDYFGKVKKFEATVVRQIGEPDESFRQRIYANLMQEGGRRRDIIRVIELLTGEKPRVIEAFNVMDTSACDSISYCDIDTVDNPSRVGDLNFPYQGLVESILPSFGNQGNNPVYGVDAGLACDRSFIIDPEPTWFLGEKELDRAINLVRMTNTIVWRKYGGSLVANYVRGATRFVGDGLFELPVHLAPPTSSALVGLASASWNSSCYINTIDNNDFTVECSTAAPPNGSIDWIAAPATVAGYGLLAIMPDAETASLAVQIPSEVLLVTPNWNTAVWLTAYENNSASFKFSVPAPHGALLNYGTFKSPYKGVKNVAPDTLSFNVYFDNPIPLPYQLILLPGWNTDYSFEKSVDGFLVTFSVPAPTGAFFYWGISAQPL